MAGLLSRELSSCHFYLWPFEDHHAALCLGKFVDRIGNGPGVVLSTKLLTGWKKMYSRSCFSRWAKISRNEGEDIFVA